MKKNVIIIVLALVSIASLIFGFDQRQKAQEKETLAKEYAEKLEEKKRAEKKLRAYLEERMEKLKMEKVAELAQEKQ